MEHAESGTRTRTRSYREKAMLDEKEEKKGEKREEDKKEEDKKEEDKKEVD